MKIRELMILRDYNFVLILLEGKGGGGRQGLRKEERKALSSREI